MIVINAFSLIRSYIQTGGPSWEIYLGRRDAREANLNGSNNNIPSPNSTFQTIVTKFNFQGLDLTDLVALLGIYYKYTRPSWDLITILENR